MIEDRIKLAEARGWKCVGEYEGIRTWLDPNESYNCGTIDLPDPFTDANDDYAVLKWCRDHQAENLTEDEWAEFNERLEWAADYEIGDYSRAALKVISDD